jgi:hypothetical protein
MAPARSRSVLSAALSSIATSMTMAITIAIAVTVGTIARASGTRIAATSSLLKNPSLKALYRDSLFITNRRG